MLGLIWLWFVAEQLLLFALCGGRAGARGDLVGLLYGWVKFSKSVGHSVGSVERY